MIATIGGDHGHGLLAFAFGDIADRDAILSRGNAKSLMVSEVFSLS